MQKTKFTAFYPSRPFWAVSKVDFEVARIPGWFDKQMAEEVFAVDEGQVTLRVCRDGRILIRAADLEVFQEVQDRAFLEAMVRRWGKYLDYLNAFYLLLDSATMEVDKLGIFNLHEVTIRDAFRVTSENGITASEDVPFESIVSVYQNDRFLHTYTSNMPIERQSRIMMRRVVSHDALAHAGRFFSRAVTKPGAVQHLSAFAKSLAEYREGKYEISLVLAWFITEAALGAMWQSHLKAKNLKPPKGNVVISEVSEKLHQAGELDIALFTKISEVRRYRNSIVHAETVPALGAAGAQLAMTAAQAMIDLLYGIKLVLNTGGQITRL